MAAGFLASCDHSMFDYEGDCDVKHILRFRYDMNLKWADAFPSEVKSVNLYIFDNNNLFVKEYTGRGDELDENYFIELELKPGRYKFVAWCGLENEGAESESFTVPQPVAGVTRLEELTCSLNTMRSTLYQTTQTDDIAGYSKERLYFMYYGYLEETIVDNHDGKRYEYLMYLTKDTNHIRIILQELESDAGMEAKDYDFYIVDANTKLDCHNELCSDDTVVYSPWKQQSATVGVGRIDIGDGSIKYVDGVVVDFSVNRLMVSHKDRMMLYILDHATGNLIARAPLIQYALLSHEYYQKYYEHPLTQQELLDREDEYIYTFFLANGQWKEQYIDILQWRIVTSNLDTEI